jgi:hypothetical protein
MIILHQSKDWSFIVIYFRPGEYPLAPYDWVQQYIQTFIDETSLSLSVIQRKLMIVFGITFLVLTNKLGDSILWKENRFCSRKGRFNYQ